MVPFYSECIDHFIFTIDINLIVNLDAPDPGFNQSASCSNDDEELPDVVDWDTLSDDLADEQHDAHFDCPFINYEAQESTDDDDGSQFNGEYYSTQKRRKICSSAEFKLVNYSSSSGDEN